MLPLPRGAVWQTLFLLCAVLFINEVRSEGRVVCYYTNWSVYRPGTAKFNPQNINPYLCTHLVYAFGGFTKDNQMKPFDKYQDIEQGGYAKFTGLKTYNKQLKTMIAIGGWNEASSRFSPLMANPERRQKFIKNILKFLRQNHFDGIDLDWEYPAQREGGKERDRDNYAQFVQELRAEFEREAEKTGRPRLLLTMAVPAGIENIEKGYDIPKLNKYLDWFNVLSYDFHSSHEPSANHHAPLYSLEEESEYNYDAELNIDYSIKYYLKAGADRDKLVLGIPTYGRSYTLINEESTEIGAPSEGPGEQGDATREKGYLAYYEICQNLKEDPEWTVVQPNPNAMGPYAYRRNQWVGYDDEAIVRKKAQYVVEHGLGGIMFWAIDNDDFRGTCSGKPYPLIEAAKESMLESLGLGINEVAKPNAPKKPSRSRSRENSSSKLNRIGGSSEGKGSSGRVTLSSGRRRVQSSPSTTTTREPETTIRLTNPEGSSLYIGGRVTTPAPPTTPDPGTDFKCEEEGFFQHPRDCKKYYWCLDSGPSGLGIVGHMFTCPSGLYFNPAADSCDFARNVPCKIKKTTTAAPISSTTTTTTTPRPTASINRISAATSRTSFFRTTTPTTTTTTPTPIEYEDEEEEIEEDVPTHFKDKEAEEDPQVIKELIELIRKVGGIEELEKHLLRKDDGTISIKSSSSESNAATTQSPISKSLYDKVLSKPNSYNSIRNRFTSSSLFRKSSQANTEQTANSKFESDESQVNEGSISSGFSKYSSVVRGNSRQGPQNEGLDKLSEFDGFLKEKKQYVTINRNRGSLRGQEDEDDVEEKQVTEHESEDDEEVELKSRAKTTRRPTNTVTPSYASIRRARPSTARTEAEEEAVSDEEVKTSKENEEKRAYTSLNRNRGRYTSTESSQKAEEVITNANRYKYLERPRPQNRLKTTFTSQDEESLTGDDEEDQEEEQNVTVQLNRAAIDSTQKSTQSTTRIYASIGRRTTTTTTETPTTQETPTRYNLLENTFNNETPEPILPNTTTATTANDSPTLSITIKNTNPEIISTVTTSTSSPTISTTNASATTITSTTSNDNELVDSLPTITTLPPTFEHESKQPLDLSLDVNSLIEKTASTANPTTASATEKLETEGAETTTARTTTTTETLTSTATTTDTDQPPTADEVTNLSNNRLKTQYKFTTRTRNVTKSTTTTANTDTDLDNENHINRKNNNNNKILSETKKTSLNTGSNSSTDDKFNSSVRGNTVKYSGGRRQQQLNELLTRKNQIQNQQTDSSNIITTTESAPTNEFLGTVSSPRPFGFPRRRTRPNNSNPTNTEDTKSTAESIEDEQSVVKTRLSATNASKTKIRTPTATTVVTATAQTRRPVLSVRRRKINSPNASSGIAYQTATTTIQTATTTTTANTFASKIDELQITTTELPTTFNKQQQQQRNRNKLVTPAATATTELTAPATITTTQLSTASAAAATAITLNSDIASGASNQKSYLNTKYRAKLSAATLSTGASPTIVTETPAIQGAAAATAPATSVVNDIIQNANANTKQPSTVLRRKFQARRLITTTTANPTDDNATEQPRTQNPLFKRRFSLTANSPFTVGTIISTSTIAPTDTLTTTLFVDGFDVDDASDQVAKSSVHTNRFNQFVQHTEDNEELLSRRELTSGIKASPLKPSTKSNSPIEPNHTFVESFTRRMGTIAATTEFTAPKRKSVGVKRRPQKYTPPTPQTPTEPTTTGRGQAVSRRRPNKYAAGDTFDRLNGNQAAPAKTPSRSSQRQVVDYDYYDDDNERVIGNTDGQQLKVILHGRGIIECLDQGNFPHPLSCRKFISCAKFETGGVVGWEYTCPKGLSYDPVGGMCNWAAGLGCKE